MRERTIVNERPHLFSFSIVYCDCSMLLLAALFNLFLFLIYKLHLVTGM